MTEEKNNSRSSDYSQYEEDIEGVEAGELVESTKEFSFKALINDDGDRLDKFLAGKLPEVSRSRIKDLIEAEKVRINGVIVTKPKQKIILSDEIEISIEPRPGEIDFVPTEMPLDVVYGDEHILVLNKPANLVVHPAPGHWEDTLLNGLLAYDPLFKDLPRAGIVHRLDKDTTGLMVVAKTEKAQANLTEQLQQRTVKREYWAFVRGKAPIDKVIDESIERDPRNPLRFIVSRAGRAKEAQTHIRLVQFNEISQKPFSWVACRLKTGRTHQIRVHMESIGLPLIGDPLYRKQLPKPKEDGSVLNSFNRQALHASRLGLIHPESGEYMEWFVEPPQDLKDLMEELKFGPVDEPVQVFGDTVIEQGPVPSVGKISSWEDFEFEPDDTDLKLWKIERTNE